MDLRPYLNPILKWWWLILITVGLAVATSSYFTSKQPAIYQAKTTLMIGRTLYDPNPTGNQFFLGQQLASLYADIAQREVVREGTKQALGISNLPRYAVYGLPSGQLIEINVSDTNPELAYLVANELARQIIDVSPSNLSEEDIKRAAFVQNQMDNLQANIIETEQQIADSQNELGALTSAREIALARDEISALQGKLTTLRTTFADLAATSPASQSNILSVVEPAALPRFPTGINPALLVAAAGLFGFVLSGGTAYLLEYMDDRIQTPDDVTKVIKSPVLGYIAEMDAVARGGPYVVEQPRSMVAEAFRTLRANLESAPGLGSSVRSMLITSPEPSDGKSSVSVNLALVIAQSGKKVVFVDADIRNPSAHVRLNISNHIGLSEIFQGETDVFSALRPYRDGLMGVITAGNIKIASTEKLNSSKMEEVLKLLSGVADIIVLDGPPMFLADAMLWSTRVDGVLMVVRPGHTRKEATRIQVEQFQRLGATIMGVVLNRIPIKTFGTYAQYRNYYPFYYGKYSKDLTDRPDEKPQIEQKLTKVNEQVDIDPS